MRCLAAVISVVLLSEPHALGEGDESFGNERIVSSSEWPDVLPVINDSHRVYYNWVNGNENFYFQGDTDAINAALIAFGAVTSEKLMVVLRPGPGSGSSFNNERTFDFNWNLHLLGGLAKHMATRDQGSNIWVPHPVLSVYVGGEIELDAIEIPEGVGVLEVADLQQQYAKGLNSNDQTVRGWSCGRIASLDPYNLEAMRRIAGMLNDEVDWVKLNAAGALSRFPAFAEEAVQLLELVSTTNPRLTLRVDSSINALRDAEADADERVRHQESAERIHQFVLKHLAEQQEAEDN